jgi:predicted transcriptional regulator
MAADADLVELTADIVAAHVSNNTVAVGDVFNLIEKVHGALCGLSSSGGTQLAPKEPVVSVRASLKPDYITCMECGRRQKALKRHLQSAHGMTPDQYRADYGLPASYPMVATNYAETRRELAKKIGLGRKSAAPRKRNGKAAGNGNAGANAAGPRNESTGK